MLIDTHCHLSKEEYDDIDFIVKEAFDNGINKLIVSGCDFKSNIEVISQTKRYNNIYGSIGYGPSDIDEISEKDYLLLEEQLLNDKIIAIGEIGLDYYWDKDRDKQLVVFENQLKIAKKLNKPVIIHNRDADIDVLKTLKKYKLKGIIHCFNGTIDIAEEFIGMGFLIGIGGIITFKNNDKLRDVLKQISIDNIVLETDSPYLAPEPFRGKKNKPLYIINTAKEIANIKQISYEEVCDRTTQNAMQLFDLYNSI